MKKPWFLDYVPLAIDYGLEPKCYLKPAPKVIQLAALLLMASQDESVYQQQFDVQAVKNAWPTYLRRLAFWAGRDLISRQVVLSQSQLADHIEWAWFFAWPLVRTNLPQSTPQPLPKVDWLALHRSSEFD